LQHSFALIEHFAIGEVNNGIAQFIEIFGVGLIVLYLLGVRIAINLEAEFGFGAIEVDDEAIDEVLSPVSGTHRPMALWRPRNKHRYALTIFCVVVPKIFQ
jgi:hypothetical protein